MFYFKYKSAAGEIVMGGYDHPAARVIEIDGIGLPDVTRNVVSYYGEPGQELLSEHADARTITLSADIVNNGGGSERLRRLAKVFGEPGTITITARGRTRAIDAVCSVLEQGDRSRAYRRITAQFICDRPYFRDAERTAARLYSRTKLIGAVSAGKLSLPQMFSSRALGGTLVNAGDLPTEPMIGIYGGGSNGNTYTSEYINIMNRTTGQHIKATYIPLNGEVLYIDVAERRIYSSLDRDTPLFCISDDTFLSDFRFEPGKNIIELDIHTNRSATVEFVYDNMYREAVF